MPQQTDTAFAQRVAEFAQAESEAALALERVRQARVAARQAKPPQMSSVEVARILRDAALQVHGARDRAGAGRG